MEKDLKIRTKIFSIAVLDLVDLLINRYFANILKNTKARMISTKK